MKQTDVKQILVATDFSKCSLSAFKCALFWNAHMPVRLHVYHCIAGMPGDWNTRSTEQPKGQAIEIAVEQMRRNFLPWKEIMENENVDYTLSFSGGNVANNITRYVDEHPIDYVFLGSHGEVKKNREKLGSNAIDVLMKVSKPVLVAKEAFNLTTMDSVVFASNFDKPARPAFAKVLDFVRPFNPVVHLLHIETPKIFTSTKFITIEAMEDFCRIASDFRTKKHFHKDSHVGHGIVDFCNELGADIISFSESGNSIFGGPRMAKPVKYLVENADQPVVFVQNDQVAGYAG